MHCVRTRWHGLHPKDATSLVGLPHTLRSVVLDSAFYKDGNHMRAAKELAKQGVNHDGP